ncbi:MAG: hypothetical protein JSR66_03125 [Proteobacteria bacterium]|nr:hypothetical protein [Pseudomonadota bacterium]
MSIEDRYTAVPTPHGGVQLIPKSISTMDAASRVQPVRRLVRARTGDDVVSGNPKSPKRISFGKTDTPAGEGRLDHSDDTVYRLQPHVNNAPGVPVRAETVESVRSQISLVGTLPPGARGPDYPVPQPTRSVVVNEQLEAEDVEFVMRALPCDHTVAVQALSRMPPSERRLFLEGLRDTTWKRAVMAERQNADDAAKADYQREIGVQNAYAQRMAAHGATMDAQHSQTWGLPESAAVRRSAAPVRSTGNVVRDYAATMAKYAAERA